MKRISLFFFFRVNARDVISPDNRKARDTADYKDETKRRVSRDKNVMVSAFADLH